MKTIVYLANHKNGSGDNTDGQVLALTDLLGLGANSVPKFVTPVANLFEMKKKLVEDYLELSRTRAKSNERNAFIDS